MSIGDTGMAPLHSSAATSALAMPDDDFLAIEVSLDFEVLRPAIDSDGCNADAAPCDWFPDKDGEPDEGLVAVALPQVVAALAPRIEHLRSIGLIRSDLLRSTCMGGSPGVDWAASFYVVLRAADIDSDPASLGAFNDSSLPLEGVPGGEVRLLAATAPINATALYEALRRSSQHLGRWGGDGTPALMPQPDEARADWLERVALSGERIDRLVDGWDVSSGDVELFAATGLAVGAEDVAVEYVGGLWPRGYASLVVGDKGSGKSTALHDWVAALSAVDHAKPRHVWGSPIVGRHMCVYVSGEDHADIRNGRQKRFTESYGPSLYFWWDPAAKTIETVLEEIGKLKAVDFVVIDPVRKLMAGNEDKSEPVSLFYDALNEFASRRNCAIVAVHHPRKEDRPSGISVADVRGSGTHVERARFVVGVSKRPNDTIDIKILKSNLLPDEPPHRLLGATGEKRSFDRIPETLSLAPVGDAFREAVAVAPDTTIAALISQALHQQLSSGKVIQSTGSRELFRQGLPELAQISRGAIRATVEAMIEAGTIEKAASGLRVAAPERLN